MPIFNSEFGKTYFIYFVNRAHVNIVLNFSYHPQSPEPVTQPAESDQLSLPAGLDVTTTAAPECEGAEVPL